MRYVLRYECAYMLCGVKFCNYRALLVCDFARSRFATLLSRAESRRDTPARVKCTRLCIKDSARLRSTVRQLVSKGCAIRENKMHI